MAGKAAKQAKTDDEPAPRKQQTYYFGQKEITVAQGTDWPECYGSKAKSKSGRCGKPAEVGQWTGGGYTWRCAPCNGKARALPLVPETA